MATLQTPPPAFQSPGHNAVDPKNLRKTVKKPTRKERAAAEAHAAANRPPEFRLPERLMTSGAAALFVSIGLGIYGLEHNSGLIMLASAAAMLLGVLLTVGALARYRFKSRHYPHR